MADEEHPPATLESQRSALAHHFAALAHSAAAIAKVLDPAVKVAGTRVKKGAKEEDGAPKVKKPPTAYTRRAACGCRARLGARADAVPPAQLHVRPYARLQAGGTSLLHGFRPNAALPPGPPRRRRAPRATFGRRQRDTLAGRAPGVALWEHLGFQRGLLFFPARVLLPPGT